MGAQGLRYLYRTSLNFVCSFSSLSLVILLVVLFGAFAQQVVLEL